MNKSKYIKGISNAKYGYFFALPFFIAFLLFWLYPTIYTAIIGFTDCQGAGNTDWHILDDPLANFKTILSNGTFVYSIVKKHCDYLVDELHPPDRFGYGADRLVHDSSSGYQRSGPL